MSTSYLLARFRYLFSILDLFDNHTSGLFPILNDECSLRNPSTENFDKKLNIAWKNAVGTPISWHIPGQKPKKPNSFVIRHFTDDVIYSIVSVCILPDSMCF